MLQRKITVSLTWGLMLLLTYTNMISPFGNVLDVLCWLGYLFILAAIVLWPHSGKDQRAELARRPNWADRIEFDSADERRAGV